MERGKNGKLTFGTTRVTLCFFFGVFFFGEVIQNDRERHKFTSFLSVEHVEERHQKFDIHFKKDLEYRKYRAGKSFRKSQLGRRGGGGTYFHQL